MWIFVSIVCVRKCILSFVVLGIGIVLVYEMRDVVWLKVDDLNNVIGDLEIYMDKVINVVVIVMKDMVIDKWGMN